MLVLCGGISLDIHEALIFDFEEVCSIFLSGFKFLEASLIAN